MNEPVLERLDASLIRTQIQDLQPSHRVWARNIEIAESLPSTNDALLARAREQSVHAVALLAEQQTAGRGRQGRAWVSPFARNLYLTLGWHLKVPTAALSGLSLVIGCALAEAIDARYGTHIALKWPNDLYLAERKMGGILIDLASVSDAEATVVVGVGLNVSMPDDAASRIDQPWTDLSQHSVTPVSRNTLAACVLSAMADALETFPEQGLAAWRYRWQSRDMLAGVPIRVTRGALDAEPELVGTGAGISAMGALRVATEGGTIDVVAGDASIRRRSDSTH